jgi:hypothetical protein
MKYFVVGEYEDGSECEEEFNTQKEAVTRAEYLIEGFHCDVGVVDENGNEYPVF